MKTSFSNSECAHVWATQKQQEGHSLHMFFEGPTIYSYGRHYPIAHFIKSKDGAFVLTNSDASSVTTEGKHKTAVRSAIRHLTSVSVPGAFVVTDKYNPQCVKALEASILKYVACVDKARRSPMIGIEYEVNNLRKYYQAFGRLPKFNDDMATWTESATLYHVCHFLSKHWKLKSVFVAKQRLDVLRAKWDTYVAPIHKPRQNPWNTPIEEIQKLWDAGEHHQGFLRLPFLLRIQPSDKSVVETTRGARVPLEAVKQGLALLDAGKLVPGLPMGIYTIGEITDTEIHVGCHTFDRKEIERFASTLV